MLPFDFYIPEKNMCIEFNGIQHYEPSIFFGGEESYKKRKNNDKIKQKFCKKNKIILKIINYKDNIEKKLNKILYD